MISTKDFAARMLKGEGITEETQIVQLWSNQLKSFHTGEMGHVFDVEYDNDMEELESSILEEGQLEPIIVRPDPEFPGMYEIIVGNRRAYVAEKNKMPIDAIIRNLSDEDAIKLMVLSNLAKRTKIKPMTYARAVSAYMDANKAQGKRTDLVKDLETKDTLTEVANDMGLSKPQARRMLRLVKLIPELQERVDDGSVPITVGVELSYLTDNEQVDLYTYMDSNKVKLSREKANELHIESVARQKKGKALSEKEISTALMPKPKEQKLVLNEKWLTTILPPELKNQPTEVKAEFIKYAIKSYSTRSNLKPYSRFDEEKFIKSHGMDK